MWRGKKKLYFEYVMCFASWHYIEALITTLCHQPHVGLVPLPRLASSFLNIQTYLKNSKKCEKNTPCVISQRGALWTCILINSNVLHHATRLLIDSSSCVRGPPGHQQTN